MERTWRWHGHLVYGGVYGFQCRALSAFPEGLGYSLLWFYKDCARARQLRDRELRV